MTDKVLKKILYAEDEEDIRVIAQIALEEIGGFDVKYCATGLEILECIDSYQPDLLLMDVTMPGMDGLTTLKEVRKNSKHQHFPAIFMTAKIQADEIDEYNAMGILGVIEKPFEPMTLALTIRELWDKQS